MKKIISIIIATTMLLVAFCSCTPSQTEFNYSSNMKLVTGITENRGSQSSDRWFQPETLAGLNYLYKERFEKELDSDILIFKCKVVGNSKIIADYDELCKMFSENCKSDDETHRIFQSSIHTPVLVEEIYYMSPTLQVKEGDIIYYEEFYTCIDEDLYSKIPNTVEKYDLKVGDLLLGLGSDSAFYQEMFLEKDHSYIIYCSKADYSPITYEYEYYEAVYENLPIYCVDREPMPVDYYGKYEEHEYQRYLNIRKDAIDYYINGNKEVLS
ncbi:MAG: hypothetical protein IKA51_05765 [Clostridia bacterium]|nr:hypothetical protein [Clostridia bacterium]